MPTIGDSITLKSDKPNFERDQVKLLLDLKNARTTQYDEGHIVYCKEDKQHYKFVGTGEAYDSTTGYFRVFNVGGGSSESCDCEALSNDELSNILV